jgi:hypothetical protein
LDPFLVQLRLAQFRGRLVLRKERKIVMQKERIREEEEAREV